MKNYSKIYADNPLNKAEQFDFKAYSKTLTDIILYKENETPITIGIHGEWGSGKTTLMKTIKETLEKPSEDKNFRKCKCVWFNAWKYADDKLYRYFYHACNFLIMQVQLSECLKNLLDS
ncbi:hypothetical protein BEH94_05965 [Candidatus Altiarchaeales archaeon WOR_SM1_SCG]|nr:hypothetical protein BEH94_05965 [Candidatus Altiarchaeales archaeon WOR_SM1_SCG]